MSQNLYFLLEVFHIYSFHIFIFTADLPNGVVSENGLPLSDKRAGKKHKRPKNSSRSVDGKFESVSLEKENIEFIHTDHSTEQFKLNNNQDANNG